MRSKLIMPPHAQEFPLPPRVVAAMHALHFLHGIQVPMPDPFGMSSRLTSSRELDRNEYALWRVAIDTLRNYINGELTFDLDPLETDEPPPAKEDDDPKAPVPCT